ncbi:alpha/beta hydrolase [Neobacillus notoginsengisoli]|uniref:Alpha/beta hydrolase n=1 Tax=Neobacillus notoginsengisoli TaxID=1578198 RepID=A0A417YZD6_9BACI|nr:alpha/beta hydrolase-fold protein [Neobacillus notoginsengisoli]RHW43279.1 alpha/beta hydrolase [Neobacillus notoginsengisoli]
MIETFSVRLFEQERKIRVYLPVNYSKATKKYPVLYMHDGQNVFDNREAFDGVSLDLHQYLNQNNVELIVVAIDRNPSNEERTNEFCPWKHGDFSENLLGFKATTGGLGKEYVDFIVNELKPLVDSKYRTESSESYIAGISLGGLISTYAACSYPTVFKRVAAIAPAFYRNQEEIENLVKISDLSKLERFYIDCGTREKEENINVSDLYLKSSQQVYDIIKDKVASTTFETIEDGKHQYKDFKKRVPGFIEFLTS